MCSQFEPRKMNKDPQLSQLIQKLQQKSFNQKNHRRNQTKTKTITNSVAEPIIINSGNDLNNSGNAKNYPGNISRNSEIYSGKPIENCSGINLVDRFEKSESNVYPKSKRLDWASQVEAASKPDAEEDQLPDLTEWDEPTIETQTLEIQSRAEIANSNDPLIQVRLGKPPEQKKHSTGGGTLLDSIHRPTHQPPSAIPTNRSLLNKKQKQSIAKLSLQPTLPLSPPSTTPASTIATARSVTFSTRLSSPPSSFDLAPQDGPSNQNSQTIRSPPTSRDHHPLQFSSSSQTRTLDTRRQPGHRKTPVHHDEQKEQSSDGPNDGQTVSIRPTDEARPGEGSMAGSNASAADGGAHPARRKPKNRKKKEDASPIPEEAPSLEPNQGPKKPRKPRKKLPPGTAEPPGDRKQRPSADRPPPSRSPLPAPSPDLPLPPPSSAIKSAPNSPPASKKGPKKPSIALFDKLTGGVLLNHPPSRNLV